MMLPSLTELEGLSADQKCDALFELLQLTIKKQMEIEERTLFIEKIIKDNYPSPEDLERFLRIPRGTWVEMFEESKSYYDKDFTEWAYLNSSEKWQNGDYPSAKQVGHGLRLLDRYQQGITAKS